MHTPPSRLLSFFLEQVPSIAPSSVLTFHQTGSSDWAAFYEIITHTQHVFIKYAATPNQAQILEAEHLSIRYLSAKQALTQPRLLGAACTQEHGCILMDKIETTSSPPPSAFARAAVELARLHQNTRSTFGMDFDNYIGSLLQKNNSAHTQAHKHYWNDRLWPQILFAHNRRLLSTEDLKRFDLLYKNLSTWIPNERPALIHGDLWRGNLLFNTQNKSPSFIDPATSYSIRELDIAMTMLFGGFPPLFYDAYEDVFPLEKDWRARIPLYQLYYLLAHLNMFGKAYLEEMRQCLQRYV